MSAVGRRYAKAIFSLAAEQKQIEAVGEQLVTAAQILQVPRLMNVAASPMASVARRRQIVAAIGQQLSLGPLVSTALLMLADRRRLREFPAIADHFRRLEDQALGRVRVLIRSAAPLSDARREGLTRVFGRLLGRTVIVRVEVEPALLGGVVVEAEGKVYDGSVRRQLELLGKQMAHPDAHF